MAVSVLDLIIRDLQLLSYIFPWHFKEKCSFDLEA